MGGKGGLIITVLLAVALGACEGGGAGGSGNGSSGSGSSGNGGSGSSSSSTSSSGGGGEVDTTPEPFSFTDRTDVERNSTVRSNPITVSGINTPTDISISAGAYSIDGGSYTADDGVINNRQQVIVQLETGAGYSETASATLTIGGVADTFSITTIPAPDGVPDPFTFTDVDNAPLGERVASGPVPITGFNLDITATVRGGEMSLNGADYTAEPLSIQPDVETQLWVRGRAPFYHNGSADVVVDVGGVSDTFTLSTPAADTTPDPFSFEDVPNAEIYEVYESNPVTIAGMDGVARLAVSAGEYRIDDGAFSSEPGTVSSGQTVTVRRPSAGAYERTVGVTLTVGDVSDAFEITTGESPPAIDTVTPASVVEGEPAFTLNVQGDHFIADSVVRWNGSDRPTTYISDTELEATINAADVMLPTNATVTVNNPAPENRDSGPVNFMVVEDMPVGEQMLNEVTPRSAMIGGGEATLTLSGGGFTGSSVVLFGGTPLDTDYSSASQLTATVPGSLLVTEARPALTVATPEAINPVSGPLMFFVTAAEDSLFFDDFNRPDSPDIGNGWTEKLPDAFSLIDGMVDSIETNAVYNNTIVYRPEAEDARDVEVGIDFIRRGGRTRYPQLNARVSRTGPDNVAIPDRLLAYDGFLYDEQGLTGLAITPMDGRQECYLARFEFDDNVLPGHRYRIRMRVVGVDPVRFMAYFDHFDTDRWETVAHGGVVHDENTQPTPELWCRMTDASGNFVMPDPYIHAGATGFNKYLEETDFYDNFYSIRVTNAGNPVPALGGLQPGSATAGSGALLLEVNGSDFFPGAVVRWDGTDLPTTYLSGSTLEIEVPAWELSAAGDVPVRVFNPGPGGGGSNTVMFTIEPCSEDC